MYMYHICSQTRVQNQRLLLTGAIELGKLLLLLLLLLLLTVPWGLWDLSSLTRD